MATYAKARYVVTLFGTRSHDDLMLTALDLDSSEPSIVVYNIPWKTAQFMLDSFPFVASCVANTDIDSVEYIIRSMLNLEAIDFSTNQVHTNDKALVDLLIECAKWIIL